MQNKTPGVQIRSRDTFIERAHESESACSSASNRPINACEKSRARRFSANGSSSSHDDRALLLVAECARHFVASDDRSLCNALRNIHVTGNTHLRVTLGFDDKCGNERARRGARLHMENRRPFHATIKRS